MKRQFRLSRSSDFKRVRGLGKSFAHPLIVLVAARAEDEMSQATRIGFSAGRNIGGAVQRNKAKRRLRECVRPLMTVLPAGWDLVLVARKPIVEAEYGQIRQAVFQVLHRASLLPQTHAA